MKIAASLNTFKNNEVLLDTLDSIRMWMTDDVIVHTDKVAEDQFADFTEAPVEIGYYHNFPRGPYRNVGLSLLRLYDRWPHHDWYCHIEWDCLVLSSDFKLDLEKKSAAFCLGFDRREYGCHIPELNRIVGQPVNHGRYLIGCCIFFKRRFVQMLAEGLLQKILQETEEYEEGRFPGYMGFSFEEDLYPTLAAHFGGIVESLGHWGRYAVRWTPDVTPSDLPPGTLIAHPIKDYNSPVREHHRRLRKRWREYAAPTK